MAINALLSGTVIGLAIAGLVPTMAAAQKTAYRSYYAYPSPYLQEGVPFSSRAAGIPGPEHACVKMCSRDSSPCDPPVYKQADGRCNYED